MGTDIGQAITGTTAETELKGVEEAVCETQPKYSMEAEVADGPWSCSTGSSLARSQIETAGCQTLEKDEEKPEAIFLNGGGKGEERAVWESGSPTVQRNGDAHSNDGSEII